MCSNTNISCYSRKNDMPLLNSEEVIKLKLHCIPLPQLRELSEILYLPSKGGAKEIIKEISKRVIGQPGKLEIVDQFMREKYKEIKIERRQKLISDDELKQELGKVKTFSWGIIQGQLDQKIQTQYVRKLTRYSELLKKVRERLHQEITNYVICAWYNHWTTCLIEEHISLHPKVVPAIKNVKGIDIFFDGQPFDLKVTYLPQEYNPKVAAENPRDLAVWMYEHQGAQRFGADNRMFVILLDKEHPNKSWELKRDFDLLFRKIDEFLYSETVSPRDEVTFIYRKKEYKTITKILMITK